MPRGVNKTYEERIAEIDVKVAGIKEKQTESNAKFKAKIEELESQRKELIDADRNAKFAKVIQYAEEKGMTTEEILAKISQ